MKRKSALLVSLILVAVLLAACSKTKSFTYSLDTGSSVTVKLDTTDGLDLKDEDGVFSVVDESGEAIIQGTFRTEDAFEEMRSLVEGSSDCNILEKEEDSITYVVNGEAGLETNRVVKLTDAGVAVVMGSLSDSSVAADAYKKLTFTVK